eukprot:4697663-Prymnesium_polylepis.1
MPDAVGGAPRGADGLVPRQGAAPAELPRDQALCRRRRRLPAARAAAQQQHGRAAASHDAARGARGAAQRGAARRGEARCGAARCDLVAVAAAGCGSVLIWWVVVG